MWTVHSVAISHKLLLETLLKLPGQLFQCLSTRISRLGQRFKQANWKCQQNE